MNEIILKLIEEHEVFNVKCWNIETDGILVGSKS
jgi:hypothetical protein